MRRRAEEVLWLLDQASKRKPNLALRWAGALALFEQYSRLRHLSWSQRGSSPDDLTDESIDKWFSEAERGGRPAGLSIVLFRVLSPLRDQLALRLRKSAEALRHTDEEVWGVELRLNCASGEQPFVELCDCAELDFASYLPEDDDGRSDAPILIAAPERDFGFMKWHPSDPQLHLAKRLAARLPRLSRFPTRGMPYRLGWLNYWSAPIAAAIGFPDSEKDARILPWCYQTPKGAWLVKLTEEPLDLWREDHQDAIVWAYWRFDKVGKRMEPAGDAAPRKPRRKKKEEAAPAPLKTFVVVERDETGQWHATLGETVQAISREEALRQFFARIAMSREPVRGETLAFLRQEYDVVAVEAGLTPSAGIDVREGTGD